MEQNETQNTVSITDLWGIFTRRFLIIIVVAVLAFLIVLGYSLFTYSSIYKSTAMIYLLRQDGEVPSGGTPASSDFSLAMSTVNDCKILLTSHNVLDKVIDELGMSLSYGKLKSMINITNPTSSRILEISVTAPTPLDAKIIVDELCRVGADSIKAALGINQINLIDSGTINVNPVNAMVTPYPFVAGLLAAAAVYGVFVLIFIFDDKIKRPEDVEKHLGLTVLGLIPYMNGKTGGIYDKPKYGKNMYGKYRQY